MIMYEEIRQQLFHLGLLCKHDEAAFALVVAGDDERVNEAVENEQTKERRSSIVGYRAAYDGVTAGESYVMYVKAGEGIALLAIAQEHFSENPPIVLPFSMIQSLRVQKGWLRDRIQFECNERIWRFEMAHRIKGAKWQKQMRKQVQYYLSNG